MRIANADGTVTGGPLDVIMLYHHEKAGTYHPVIYVEAPMPGPVPPFDLVEIVRLKSDQHHTEGSPTLEGGWQLLAELRAIFIIPDQNVYTDQPVPWNGEIGDVMIVPNWRKRGEERSFTPVIRVAA
jgi:hypothetical protein